MFRHRTALPLPIALAIMTIPAGETRGGQLAVLAGVLIAVLGEGVRLWAVHHIGVISRTRSERLGPLVASGPFAIVRNPLYLGNIALWAGFALAARLMWLAPLIVVLLGLEYHAIVRWEERLLESRLGDAYRTYAARVPRWIPHLHRGGHGGHGGKDVQVERFTWNETLFSERGTLVAIAAGFFLLWLKARS
jgi:protein-S-isoprenylcysteine O-methyltransferase Ste14